VSETIMNIEIPCDERRGWAFLRIPTLFAVITTSSGELPRRPEIRKLGTLDLDL
jgi:hypothetical protein